MSRRVVACVMAATAALALVPGTVHADQPFSGSASTTTLSLTVSPGALLTVPGSVVSALPQSVSSLLTATLQPISAEVDGAHSTGTRSGSGLDLSAGHADVTPISLQLAPLSQLLTALHNALTSLWGEVTLPALQSTLANVATITGSSTVMSLLPSTLATQLTALNSQLSTLTTTIAGLPDVLTAAVDQLKATLVSTLTQGLTADLPNSTYPNGQNSTQVAVTVPPAVPLLPLVPSLPVVAKLSPFTATAVNAAGAQHFGVSGPQASTNQGASAINLAPAMSLTSLQNDLATLQTTMQQVSTSITAIAPKLGAVTSIIATVLPGGLDLSALSNQLSAATAPVGDLIQLAQTQLNNALACNDLGTGTCSLASSYVIPEGTGVHATAASKLVDLQVLQLNGVPGVTAGTALLDLQGVQATTDAFIDGASGNQQASSNVPHLAVAGINVIDNGQVDKATLTGHVPAGVLAALPDALPAGQTTSIPVTTPAGTFTVAITAGMPQTTFTSSTHRSVTLTTLEVRLINGAPDGTGVAPDLGLVPSGTIATADVGAVTSEVLGQTLVPTSTSNVTLQQTGMFGPGSLVVGFLLLGGGVALRRVPGRGRRRSAG